MNFYDILKINNDIFYYIVLKILINIEDYKCLNIVQNISTRIGGYKIIDIVCVDCLTAKNEWGVRVATWNDKQ